MAYVQINGAKIYYQVYGSDQSGRVPVQLIHGSTITGEIDWSEIAPRLAAAGYKVYVPDCRGHGKSSNPGGVYTFKQLGADAAAFVKAMGYERMHIIGHSMKNCLITDDASTREEVIDEAIAVFLKYSSCVK